MKRIEIADNMSIYMWISCYPFLDELSSCIHSVPAIYMKLLCFLRRSWLYAENVGHPSFVSSLSTVLQSVRVGDSARSTERRGDFLVILLYCTGSSAKNIQCYKWLLQTKYKIPTNSQKPYSIYKWNAVIDFKLPRYTKNHLDWCALFILDDAHQKNYTKVQIILVG